MAFQLGTGLRSRFTQEYHSRKGQAVGVSCCSHQLGRNPGAPICNKKAYVLRLWLFIWRPPKKRRLFPRWVQIHHDYPCAAASPLSLVRHLPHHRLHPWTVTPSPSPPKRPVPPVWLFVGGERHRRLSGVRDENIVRRWAVALFSIASLVTFVLTLTIPLFGWGVGPPSESPFGSRHRTIDPDPLIWMYLGNQLARQKTPHLITPLTQSNGSATFLRVVVQSSWCTPN